MTWPAKFLWTAPRYVLVLLVLLPIAIIVSSWSVDTGEIWSHLRDHLLAEITTNSILLLTTVVASSAVLGVGLAALVSFTDYPGKRWFSIIFLCPLAVPTYVFGFVYLGIFDYSGPLQTLVRQHMPEAAQALPNPRSLLGVSYALTLGLYPYVYWLVRQAFFSQGIKAFEVCRSLGYSAFDSIRYGAIPLAKPWIISGSLLISMETLADFGTVSVYSFNTFTTAIYESWYGFFSPPAAAQLSSLLLIFTLTLLVIESSAVRSQKFQTLGAKISPANLIKLSGFKATMAVTFSILIALVSFFIPVLQLLLWATDYSIEHVLEHTELIANSFSLAGICATLIVGVSVFLSLSHRFFGNNMSRITNKITCLGYAIPGSILAVGVFIPFNWLEKWLDDLLNDLSHVNLGLIFTGSSFVLILGLIIRFLAVGFSAIESAMNRIPRKFDEVCSSLGTGRFALVSRVIFPLVRPGIFAGLTLAFVDVMKEMPLVLMTRPFQWDTLSVRIYELTSEGEWELAAFPSLLLIGFGMLPVVLLYSKRHTNDM